MFNYDFTIDDLKDQFFIDEIGRLIKRGTPGTRWHMDRDISDNLGAKIGLDNRLHVYAIRWSLENDRLPQQRLVLNDLNERVEVSYSLSQMLNYASKDKVIPTSWYRYNDNKEPRYVARWTDKEAVRHNKTFGSKVEAEIFQKGKVLDIWGKDLREKHLLVRYFGEGKVA